MSSVFNELKEEILPELRRSQIVNSTDIQGKTDAEIMAAFKNGQGPDRRGVPLRCRVAGQTAPRSRLPS